MFDGGKGSTPRPLNVDRKTYEDNWDKTFRKKTPQEIDDEKAEEEAFELLNKNSLKNNKNA